MFTGSHFAGIPPAALGAGFFAALSLRALPRDAEEVPEGFFDEEVLCVDADPPLPLAGRACEGAVPAAACVDPPRVAFFNTSGGRGARPHPPRT